MKYSIIIPLFNEAEIVNELINRTMNVLNSEKYDYELIMVDDGSDDKTILEIKQNCFFEKIILIELIKNYGQTIALRAGIEASTGDIIICMDGDLQHNPEDIPQFINNINDGFDLVSGYKTSQGRKSKTAHYLIKKITGVNLNYFGASFKAFRRDIIDTRLLTGNAHRYIGVFLAKNSKKIKEIQITIEPRLAGKSKYIHNKVSSVLIELLTLHLISNEIISISKTYKRIGFTLLSICISINILVVILNLFFRINIKEEFIVEFILNNFILICGLLLFLFGIQFEIQYRTNNNKTYFTKKR